MPLTKELALVRLQELSTSCVVLSTDMIEHVELDDDLKHLLNRWLSLTSRIVEVTNNQHKIKFDADIAIKFMLLEIKKQLEDFDKTAIKTATLDSRMETLRISVDNCLNKLEHISI